MNNKKVLLLLAVILGFVLLNVGYGLYSKKKSIHGMVSAYSFDDLSKAYPGWTKENINSLWLESEIPFVYSTFVDFKEKPVRGTYVNVDENGFRHIKNQAPWPPPANHTIVFFFGGSTAFGYGVEDHGSIPSHLQELLNGTDHDGKPVSVYNFGRGFYRSTMERILFTQLIEAGHVPDIAIFLDGLNDNIAHGFRTALSAELTQFIERPLVASIGQLSKEASRIPLARLTQRIMLRLSRYLPKSKESTPQNTSAKKKKVDSESIELINTWKRNRKMIEGTANEFGVRTVFVWQPIPLYKYDIQAHPFYKKLDRNHLLPNYEVMASQRSELEKGKNFLWLADLGEGRSEVLYCDAYHYTSQFNREIAQKISEFILN